jgi:hypothetical protein
MTRLTTGATLQLGVSLNIGKMHRSSTSGEEGRDTAGGAGADGSASPLKSSWKRDGPVTDDATTEEVSTVSA